ncbi:chromosome segregation protein SMC [archaeon]|nr:chromosome segregation protein SMC [archaeon]
MTKIVRMTMHGFKSFAHKTSIEFGDQYNCILGPNGSGKSNVGDALCFVLGRLSAKAMRAEKAANLIFNGGKNKTPSSKGVVEIEFDNSNKDFNGQPKKVIVSRTITKKGTSIYRINEKKVTRTQIIDLLAGAHVNPDGYNIILQGDITRFVDMPGKERRGIIEQISDVSHYEDKKKKALLELAKAEEKINSAEIILKERKAYLRELKKDRDQALKFKEMKDKVDSYRASYLKKKIDVRREENKNYLEKIEKYETKVADFEAKINEMREQIEIKRDEISKINSEIEEKGEKEQVAVHKEIEDIRTELIKKEAREKTLQDEIHKISMRKKQFEAEQKDLTLKLKEFSNRENSIAKELLRKAKELEILTNKIEQFRGKHKLGDVASSAEALGVLETQIEEQEGKVREKRLGQQDLLREKDRLEFRLQTIDEQINKVKELKVKHKDQLQELKKKKQDFKAATLKLNKVLEQESSYVSQIAHARRKLISLQEDHAKLSAQVNSIQANAAASHAVKNILDNKRKFGGVHGTVAQLGQVKKKYSIALETAAGGRTQQIVVDDDGMAAKCISYLRDQKLGRASFIPLNKVRSVELRPEDKKFLKLPGVIDFAINLVSYESRYKKAFAYVFSRTLVVENMNSARKVGIGKIPMVTLEGDQAAGSGVMTGGFRKTARGGVFAEKDSIEKLSNSEAAITNQQAIISKLERDRAAGEEEISDLRKLKGELEGEIIAKEKKLHLDSSDLDASSDLKKDLRVELKEVDIKLRELQKEVVTMNRTLAGLKGEKQMLRGQMMKSNDPKVQAQLSSFEETRQQLREDMVRLNSEKKSLTEQATGLVGAEQEKILEIIKQHDKELSEFSLEVAELNGQIKVERKGLVEKEKASKAFYAQYKELFAKREKLSGDVRSSEGKIDNLREKSRSSERELNMLSLKNAEVRAKLSILEEEFEQFKDVELCMKKSEKELYAEISRFEALLSQMSAVNMKALEIYDKVEEEFNKLVEKKDSLLEEKTTILTLMNEIEVKKKEKFMGTFTEVDKHFREIFSKLFKKGDAYLHLENKDNPFDDGMSIKVKITGKRHMDLKGLSGGEKTLTALAFIFAVQEHQPATFYILDEIDAALDKHNSDRLAKLIGMYSDRAQYIVISHNDAVISEATHLYGVSMSDGVSKVTSLKI